MSSSFLDGEDIARNRFDDGSRRPRRWLRRLVGIVSIAVVGLAAFAIVRHVSHKEPLDPAAAELPPLPEDQRAVTAFLASTDGAIVRGTLAAADAVLATEDLASCQSAIAALDALGTPDVVFAAAAKVPDQATSDMVVSNTSSLTRYLGMCLRDGTPPVIDDLQFTTTVLHRRLDQLG
jgi:hypothetical protein